MPNFCQIHGGQNAQKGVPFRVGIDCRLCWLQIHDQRYRNLSGLLPITSRIPCVHLDPDEITPARRIELGLTHAKVWRECGKGLGPKCRCDSSCGPLCQLYEPDHEADPMPQSDPPQPAQVTGEWPTVGVSIGHFGMPGLVELQAKVIRAHCGDVPIVVSDDFTEESGDDGLCKKDRLLEICERYKLIYRNAAPSRIGHAGGDLGAFKHGLNYAASRGIEYWMKLSQRFIIDRPMFLQKLAAIMREKNAHTMGNVHKNRGKFFFSVRTECLLMHVPRWHRPDILAEIEPRVLGRAAENVIEHCINKLGGKKIANPLFTDDRARWHTNIYWYEQPHAHEAYITLAAKYDVDLGLGFHVQGSLNSPGFKWG